MLIRPVSEGQGTPTYLIQGDAQELAERVQTGGAGGAKGGAGPRLPGHPASSGGRLPRPVAPPALSAPSRVLLPGVIAPKEARNLGAQTWLWRDRPGPARPAFCSSLFSQLIGAAWHGEKKKRRGPEDSQPHPQNVSRPAQPCLGQPCWPPLNGGWRRSCDSSLWLELAVPHYFWPLSRLRPPSLHPKVPGEYTPDLTWSWCHPLAGFSLSSLAGSPRKFHPISQRPNILSPASLHSQFFF